MIRVVFSSLLLCAACGSVEQPKSAKTVAAYEVPLRTASDKRRFVALLSEKAKAFGFHVDAATADELKVTSEVSKQTFNATVWRGKDDDEPIASAMDFQDRLGRVWISFSLGSDPGRSRQFREAIVPAIENRWPDIASLPIMPSGAIPLQEDLVRSAEGYIVKARQQENTTTHLGRGCLQVGVSRPAALRICVTQKLPISASQITIPPRRTRRLTACPQCPTGATFATPGSATTSLGTSRWMHASATRYDPPQISISGV